MGESQGFWVQTGALIISAIGGILIILSRSGTERRRATVDLVLQLGKHSDLAKARQTFRKLRTGGQTNFATFLSQKDSEEHMAIMLVLNMHEFTACGIRGKAYDEKLYKRMQCSVIVRDWIALSGFIVEFRKTRDPEEGKTFYQDFQWLAERWQKDPLKPCN